MSYQREDASGNQMNAELMARLQEEGLPDGISATWVGPTNTMPGFHQPSGYYRVQVDQPPVITVPVYQEIQRRDKIIEVPQTIVKDKILPKVYHQEVIHEVPKVEVEVREKEVEVPTVTVVEKIVSQEQIVGFNPKYVPTWEVREVPKLVPKFVGEQKVMYIEVPQIHYVDKVSEKEVVVDVIEKVLPTIVEVEEPVEVIRYKWKEIYDDIPIVKYVPKFDVEVVCPAPLIVPYVQPEVKDLPPLKVTLGPDGAELGGNANLHDVSSVPAPFPIPDVSGKLEQVQRQPDFMRGNMPVNVRMMPAHEVSQSRGPASRLPSRPN